MWVKFKTGFVEAERKVYPIENDQNRFSIAMDRCNDQKEKKLYLCARKSKYSDVKIHKKRFRAHVQKVLRDAYWKYVSNRFTFENDSSDPALLSLKRLKSFCHLSNLLKRYVLITSVRKMEFLTDAKEKANICNRQFQLAFTREGNSDPFSMLDITVEPKGVAKQKFSQSN